MTTLTKKQRVFADEYLLDLNATQAAIRAGYSKKTAEWIGPQLLGKTHVAEAISERMKDRERRTEITQDAVLKELAKIGFANMADYMKATPDGDPYLDFSSLTRDQAAALIEVTVEDFVEGRGDGARSIRKVKFKLADKKGALVDIGKHLGMFTNKVEIAGKDGGPIEFTDTERLKRLNAIFDAARARRDGQADGNPEDY